MNKKVLTTTFGIFTLILACGYIFYIAVEHHKDFALIKFQVSFTTLVFPIALSVLAGFINAYAWFKINKTHSSTKLITSYFAWSSSRLYRYIPGKIFGYYLRHKLQKTSPFHSIAASLNEFQSSLIPLSLICAIYFSVERNDHIVSLFFLITSVLIFIAKPILLFLSNNTKKIKPIAESMLNLKLLSETVGYAIFAIFFHGLAFYIMVSTVFFADNFSMITAIFCLYVSAIIGQLSFISPAGLGVKEASMTAILVTQGFTAEVSLIIALSSRTLLVFSEVVNMLLALVLRNIIQDD